MSAQGALVDLIEKLVNHLLHGVNTRLDKLEERVTALEDKEDPPPVKAVRGRPAKVTTVTAEGKGEAHL